eukprot:c15375_g1_i1 orf=121-375(-)
MVTDATSVLFELATANESDLSNAFNTICNELVQQASISLLGQLHPSSMPVYHTLCKLLYPLSMPVYVQMSPGCCLLKRLAKSIT